eukprot:14267096-Ditylum_brightwellii.AAC.1
MTSGKKPLKWRNAVQNHQNSELLPALDQAIKGYKPCELYQWEMCVQFHLHGSSMQKHTPDVGKNIKSLLIELQETHRKDKFSLLSKKGKRVLIE